MWVWAGGEEFSKFDLVVHRNMAKERKISLVLLIPPQSNVTERHRWMRHNQMWRRNLESLDQSLPCTLGGFWTGLTRPNFIQLLVNHNYCDMSKEKPVNAPELSTAIVLISWPSTSTVFAPPVRKFLLRLYLGFSLSLSLSLWSTISTAVCSVSLSLIYSLPPPPPPRHPPSHTHTPTLLYLI